jgi:hypothetical protein
MKREQAVRINDHLLDACDALDQARMERFDEIIFSAMKATWRKTVMMVGLVMDRCKELELPISYEMIAARLKVLADTDRIEGIGDLRMWRNSEVRLKD